MTLTARSGSVTSRGAPFVVGGVVLAAAAVVAAADLHEPGRFPTCPLLALTGFACPLCGGLRVTDALLGLDVGAAWGANPLLTVLAPLVVAAWSWWCVRAVRGRPPARPGPRLALAAVAVLVAFGVLRNVPGLSGVLTPWLG